MRDSYTKTLKLYANGVLIGESVDTTGSISDNDEPLTVGNVNVNFNNFFEGTIDEFTIYKGAMSSAKVKERYNEYVASGIETALQWSLLQNSRLYLPRAEWLLRVELALPETSLLLLLRAAISS